MKRNHHNDRDAQIDELLKMDFGQSDIKESGVKNETEELNVEDKSIGKGLNDKLSKISQPKRFLMGWLLLLFVVPPPLGYIMLKMNKVKLKWYHKLLVLNVFGMFFLILLFTVVILPMQTKLNTAMKLKQRIIIEEGRASKDGYSFSEDGSFDIDVGSQSYNPNFSGSLELDYSKLSAEDKPKAQRYQLIKQVADMMEIDPINIYGLLYVESSLALTPSDIYQEMHSTGEGADKHSIGPAQISQSPKHLAHAFESKYSTRTGSPKDDSVMSIKKGLEWSDTAMKDNKSNPLDLLPSNHTILDISGGYTPAGQELEWSQNIKPPSNTTRAYHDRLLEAGDTSYGGDGSSAKYHLRPNPFYYPDVVYSLGYDMVWASKDIEYAATQIIEGKEGKLARRSPTRKLGWTKSEAQRYLDLPDIQKVGVAYVYMCDWYLGSMTASGKGESAFKAWQKLGIFAMDVLDKYGSLSLDKEFTTKELWARIDGRDSSSKALLYKGTSLVEEFGYYDLYASISSGSGGSKNWEAFTYGIRGINGAYSIFNKEKSLFEGAVMKDYNGPTVNTGGQYTKIIDLAWADANRMFPRKDASGGPAVIQLIDVDTGKEFSLTRSVGTNHADVEATTAQDTAIIKQISGSKYNDPGYNNQRAVLIKGTGVLYAASLACTPHAGVDSLPFTADNLDYVKGNDMDGVLDLHFRGSKTHGSNKVDKRHQDAIDKAVKATQYLSTNPPSNESEFGPVLDFNGVYPAVISKNINITQSFTEHGSKAIDVQILPHVNKDERESNGNTYKQSVRPIVPIYNVIEGEVIRVKCHNPTATGNYPSWDKAPKEASDHSKKTINTYYINNSNANWAEGDTVYVLGVDGKTYYYMHMFCGSVKVKEGDKIKPGTIVGYEGNTGWVGGTTGIHLHLQIKDSKGNYYDPTKFITMGMK